MTERERYKRAFSVLESSRRYDMEDIFMARKRSLNKKRALTLAIAAALMLALGISAYAVGEDTIKRMLGWDKHIEQSECTNEAGERITHTHYGISEPVRIEDGRMFFIVNGEYTDITDTVTRGETYTYSYQDAGGYTYMYIIGLNGPELESYGYAEFVRGPGGSWQGGHSHKATDDAPWLERGKQEFNLPW